MNDKHKIFIDEAGNTGSRLIDSQPFLSMVAIGLPENRLTHIISALEAMRKRERIAGELHAKSLRDWRRTRIARELLEVLMKEEMSLFLGICEKHFVISTFIDDDFLDPAYNDKCDNSFTWPFGKRERASLIHSKLSEEAAQACSNFFQKGEGAESALALVIECLKGTPLHELMLGVKINELEETIRDLNCNPTEHSMKRGVLKSPNFFTIMGMFSKIEYHYRFGLVADAEIIFDSSPQYDSSFISFFDLLKKANPSILGIGREIPHIFGYESVKQLKCESSSSEPILQIADVIATSINDLMTKLAASPEPPYLVDDEIFLIWLIFQHWHEFDDRFCDYVMSDFMFKRMWGTIVANTPELPK